MAQQRKMFGAVADRNSALIFAEHQVEEPINRMLKASVSTDSSTEGAGVALKSTDMEEFAPARHNTVRKK